MTKKFFYLFILFLFIFVFFNKVSAQVCVTSTPQKTFSETPFENKVKANFPFAVFKLEMENSSNENLDSITITISTTTQAVPTSTATSSFDWAGVFKDNGDNQFNLENEEFLATTSVNLSPATTTISISTSTLANGTFWVVLKTSNLWTDNGAPQDGKEPQNVKVILENVIASSSLATISGQTTTETFFADTHSETPHIDTILASYDSETENYILYSQGEISEMGVLYFYSTSSTSSENLLATTSVNDVGEMSVSLSNYYSSVWLSLKDGLENFPSPLIKYDLPPKPEISFIKALSDRIIFRVTKELRGDQVMNCSNYKINGSELLNCGEPGYPFLDFFGNQIIIKNLNLTVGDKISFSVSKIQDIQNQFPLEYSTSSLLVTSGTIPLISSISPSATTTGAKIKISGDHFGDSTGTVLFCGGFDPQTGPQPPVPASTTFWSDDLIEVIVPPQAKTGPLQVMRKDGLLSDVTEATFFEPLVPGYFKINLLLPDKSTTTITTSTNMRIFIGSLHGENVYYVGDSKGTTFDSSNYIYNIPAVPSMGGGVWAFDATGYYLPSPMAFLMEQTSTSSPLILTLQGTTTYKVIGKITLGESCTQEGKNKTVAVMALLEEMEKENKEIQPVFFETNENCTTSFAIALPGPGTYRVEAHLPPWFEKILLLDPPAQKIKVSTSSPIANVNFTFTQADRRIRGRILDKNGEILPPQKYQDFWVFAFQPKEDGVSDVSRVNSQGYFDLYVTEGVYKIEVSAGPALPFPIQKDILVDSSDNFAISNDEVDIVIKLAPPTTYIEGYVKDGAGNGISNVDIYCWCEGGPGGGHALTDSQGYYKMYVPPCSNYHVGGFAKDYGELPEKTGISVTLNENALVNFIVDTENLINISGNVSKNSSPLSFCDVWITQGKFGFGKEIGAGRTDISGNFNLKIRKGLSNLWLHVGLPGQGEIYKTKLNEGYQINSDFTKDISISTAILEIRLSPGNTFSNVFIGAHSQIAEVFTSNCISTSTNYDVYQIEVPFENGGTQYTIEGGIPDFGPLPATTTLITTSTIITIDLKDIKFYTVSGIATTSDGSLPNDAFVWARGENGGGGEKIGQDGTFSLKLREGIYDIGIGKTGYTGSVTSVNVTSNITNLVLTLTKNQSQISGKVEYNGTPIANALVWADDGRGGWAGSVSEADGSFVLNVSPGEWKVSAIAEGYELSSPIRVLAPAENVILNLTPVDFQPKRKEKSIKPVQGGVIQTSDAKLELPPGALGSETIDTTIKLQNTMKVPQGKGVKILSNKAKEVSAYYSTGDNKGRSILVLNKEAVLEIKIEKSELISAGVKSLEKAKKMKISYYDSTASNWVEIPTVVILDPPNANWENLNSITLRAKTSHFSAFAPSLPTEGAPPTPTGLSATAGDQKVTLNWNASEGATKYNIYYKVGEKWPFLTQTQNTSFTHTGLTNGVTYYYKVSALNDADQESAASEAVSATPQASPSSGGGGGVILPSNLGDTIPPSISDIKLNVGDTFVKIFWKTSEPSISWILYGTTTDYAFEIKTATFTTSHSLTLTNLSPSTTYHFVIKSKDENSNIASFTDKTFTTLGEKLAKEKKPSEMTVEQLKAEIIRLQKLIIKVLLELILRLQAKLEILKR